jgi:hypothetical protein
VVLSDLNPFKRNQTRVVPYSEVWSKPEGRRFTGEYTERILKEVAACKGPGQIGTLLRREGLYSFNVTNCRKQMVSRDPTTLEPHRCGSKTDPFAIEYVALQ